MTGCNAGVAGQCGREIYSKGLCRAHYSANYHGQDLNYEIRDRAKHNAQGVCGVEDCGGKFYARGMCRKHYARNRYREMKEKAAKGL